MSSFLQANWVALVSLAVALIGGVPGLMAVLDQFRKRVRFGVEVVSYITGNVVFGDGPELTHVLLTLTIWNKGERPLSPAYFEFEIKLRDRWLQLRPTLIPSNVPFDSPLQQIALADQDKHDLQRFLGAVTLHQPVLGHLMFVTDEIKLNDLRAQPALHARLTCRDVFGKRHTRSLVLRGGVITTATEYPKHGIVVNRRVPTS